ncbi:MAG: SDR family oxidoreductase [Actinomycetota bacterium]
MKVLVTGAAGFIGSHLCRRLIAEDHGVVGLDDLSDGSRDNIADLSSLRLIEADLRDETAVLQATAGIDVIFHQGAKRSVPRSIEFPAETTDVNVRGTLNVLSAARERGARVVFASSSSVYGDQERFPLSETFEPRPQSPYAASKVAGEIYCQSWWRTFGTPTICLRYFNVFGPGQDPLNEYAVVVPRFIHACLTGQAPVIHGDGQQARDFTYIDDVVEANLLATGAGEEAWGRVMNIGGGRTPTSVNRLLEIVATATGSRREPVHEPPRSGDVRFTQADISLARSLIGYVPKVGIEEGVRRTAEWFRKSGI